MLRVPLEDERMHGHDVCVLLMQGSQFYIGSRSNVVPHQVANDVMRPIP